MTEGSQIVPSCSLDSDAIHSTSPTQSMKDYHIGFENDHAPSSEFIHEEIGIKYTGNTLPPMQGLAEEDAIRNSELLEREGSNKMAEVPDEQNRRNRSCTTSNSSNDDQNEKSSIEIINIKIACFPDELVILLKCSYLYRIDIAGDNDLGFIAPCQLPKLPKFYLYKNDDALEVQLFPLGSIDYEECGCRLEYFCQYLFEEVFDGMHTGLNSTLNFDLKYSTFQLLPCLLKKSGELDYQRMTSICDRKKKAGQELFELNDHEVYIRLKPPDKQFYTSASGSQKDSSKVSLKRIEKPNMDYLKKVSSPTNKKQKTLSPKLERCSIEVLRYAPLNQTDLELIYKLPSALVRISQLYHIEPLKKLLAGYNQSYSVIDAHQMSIVTFDDYLLEIFSSDPLDALPLISLDYNHLLPTYNGRPQLPPDLLFQSITASSAVENTNMEILETLGDCFLKLAVSLSLYHRYPFDDSGKLTEKRSKQVSNKNLYRISIEKELKHYLNTTKITFSGDNANWIPPGCSVDERNSKRYLEQKVKPKVLADMIEALIGAFLVYAGYSTAIKFMNWLGLDVIPPNEHGIIELPSVFRIKEPDRINEIKNAINEDYHKRSFADIENKIKYTFADKAYVIAAFTHPSCSNNVNTINYKRLKYVGNALLEFLITRYILITKKSVTPGHITDVRQDLLNNDSKADIMVANDLHREVICILPKPNNSKSSNTANKDFSTDENNVTQQADVFEALIAAIFFDSNYSLSVVWNVIDRLVRQYTDLHSLIEKPNLNLVRFFRENGGKIIDECADDNGNFVCQVKLPDGTEIKGLGKSKRFARQSAGKKIEEIISKSLFH